MGGHKGFCSTGRLSCSETQHQLGHIWFCAMKTKGELLLTGLLQIELQLHSLDQAAGKNIWGEWGGGEVGTPRCRWERAAKQSLRRACWRELATV